MSANSEFITYVRKLLLPLGDIKEGNFFSGFAFQLNQKQFAMIMGNTLYFCVNNNTRRQYQALAMEPFS